MKYTLKILFLLIFTTVPASSISLDEALIESINNNLTLKINKFNLEIAKEDIFQSKSDFLPNVSLVGSIAQTDSKNIMLQTGNKSSDSKLNSSSKSIIISQSIFNGYFKEYDLKSSKLSYELQELILKKSKQDVILETIDIYYNTLIAKKTYRAYVENFNAINTRFLSTKKEFEVGLASKTDVAQAESFMNTAKINMLNSKINYNNLINSFNDLVGVKAENLIFSKILTSIPLSKKAFNDLILNNNLAILIAKTNLDIKTAQVGTAESILYPQINLTASKTEVNESTSIVDSATVDEIKATISWPIFNSGKSLSTVKQAKKVKNTYLILLQKTQMDTITLASTIWEQSVIVKETIEAAKLSYEASKTAFEGTKIEQEVGERTILDVLNAQQTLLTSEIEFFNQQKNQEVIKAQLLYLIGELNIENIVGK